MTALEKPEASTPPEGGPRSPDRRWLWTSLGAALIAYAFALGAMLTSPRLSDLPGAGIDRPDERAPLLLVPGWTDGPLDLYWLRERFVDAGWPAGHVSVVEFEEPWGGGAERIPVLDEAIAELSRRTGAPSVDVVAHSLGGLSTRVLLSRGESRIRRIVFLATPHAGSMGAWFAVGEAARDLRPGSEFVREAASRSLQIPALDVVSAIDLRVLPPEHARLPGIATAEVCCPGHKGLLFDREAFLIAADFLSPPLQPSARPR